ncbi:hypothetical protein [Streptomyces noursei]|nr:hypothetical protein [Streptomyces noursei]MCZ1016652.1 hypothetical protein [Streptomyces noursei]
MYSVPRDGEYQARRHGLYGEDVEVPGLGVKIATGSLARYA